MALETRSAGILRFGVFEVDVRTGELRKQGVRIKLQDQPFHVLTVLLQRPGEVVTREELRNQNWPADTFVDFDNSLNTAINKLREALGTLPTTLDLSRRCRVADTGLSVQWMALTKVWAPRERDKVVRCVSAREGYDGSLPSFCSLRSPACSLL